MKKILLLIALAATFTAHADNKPYITRVYDFMPAPGQFVNSSPSCSAGEPIDSVLARVAWQICGRDSVRVLTKLDGTVIRDTLTLIKPGLISLGSYGGYVVFGFDHPVVNVAGELDFQIFGNAMGSDSLAVSGGSSEPGIVMVSRDVNGNGIPDDPWYELAGSDYGKARTQKHFTITYYKPDENKTPVSEPPFITDAEYIRWTCNSTDSLAEGYVRKNSFHAQSYWPLWAQRETLTFTGTKLPCNAVDESGKGTYWVQYFLDWGYVDNRNDYDYGLDPFGNAMTYEQAVRNKYNLGFNIDWAVDDEGNSVPLSQVDFIKVYSAVLQDCGWLGETSTEVKGGIDLHPDAVASVELRTGDLNGDGNVDVTDVSILIDVVLGKEVSLAEGAVSDLNGDGNVDVSDVSLLIDIILGL